MICRFCRDGADINTAWRTNTKLLHREEQAQHLHYLCTGCDCQHATGVASLRAYGA